MYTPKCDRCEHFNSCTVQQSLKELSQTLWNINREKCGRTDGFVDGKYVKDITAANALKESTDETN